MTMSKFVWFEYVSTDANKAQGFFGELFGWGSKKVPMPDREYTMIAQGDATIGGYLPPPEGAPKQAHWLSHLRVDSAKESAQKVKSLGGKILMDAFKVGEHGTMAVVADPLGAPLALWQPSDPKVQSSPAAVGRFCWNELTSQNPTASVTFYKALGGFGEDSMEMGPMGTYHLLKNGEISVAGIMKPPMPEAPHAWTPYVQVASTDATIEKAKRLGANIIVPATDVPNVGRFAIFADPQGAVLGILQPS
jgi:uncharacterized protein